MSPKDPERLATADESNEGLRELLDAGRRELPTEAQMASLAGKLGPIVGGGDGSGGDGGGSGGAGGGESVLATLGGGKLLAGIVVASLAVWGGQQFLQPSSPSARDVKPVPSAALPVATESSAPSRPASEDIPELLPLPVPSASVAPKPPPVPVSPKPSASVSPTFIPALPPLQDSASELKLLQRAQDALLTTPADALSLADEDIRRFPDGLLRQEADVLAIDALVHLGRREAAEARAAKFREAHPRSTHLRRIDAILGRGSEGGH